MSDLQSSQTQYAILRRIPIFLQQKRLKKNSIFDKFNREATFEEFLDFMEDPAAAYKTHIGKEVIRQRLEKKKQQKPTDEKKETKQTFQDAGNCICDKFDSSDQRPTDARRAPE